ncbi:hypothetical protein [Paenibacillus fonticola]|uniref:hypothetical protein n=1 Tax=Paenibacillus fonticola TaxID=379896 RepID=UPI000360407F|nr:hypothetical protein [Paenibacillus fonticola]
MRSVSFLCGALVGAAAVVWAAKKNGSMSGQEGKGTIMKLAGLSMGGAGKGNSHQSAGNSGSAAASGASSTSSTSSTGSTSGEKVYPSSASPANASHSKEYNLKQITDFIKGNADVRREVEQILKETNSVIPGL